MPPARNPAGAVYGTVIAGSVIAAESAGELDLVKLSITVVVTLVVYWAAHVYAELVGLHITSAGRLTRAAVVGLLREESTIVTASFGPLAVIVVSAALGAAEHTAVLIGLWSIVVLLAGWALIAGRRSRMGRWELAGYTGVSTLFGCAIVLLKVLLY